MLVGDVIDGRREVAFRVSATPATFATAGEKPWRAEVEAAAAIAVTGQASFEGRLGIDLDFVLPTRPGGHPGWDLDNLIKPTIDALATVIGSRPGQWRSPQVDDERVDEIRARKREVLDGESPHGTIRVWTLDPSASDQGAT